MNRKDWYKILFISLISISLVFFFYKQKQGLFLDETYTYLFVGGNGFNYDGVITDTWQDTSFYQNLLTIQENERFNLKRVYNNNHDDVHPPLYFLLLSIFLSLFSVNNFSVLIGIIFNLIFHIAIIILLYKLLKKMSLDSNLAFFLTLMFAINLGTISNVLYIRMYELATFWGVLNIYLHQKIIDLFQNSSKNHFQYFVTCSLIAIVTFLGILTHYHYLVFIMIIAFFFNIYLLIKKQYRNLFIYDIEIIMSVLLVFIVFPNAINDIFHSSVGTVSIHNFLSRDFFTKIFNFLKLLNQGLVANNCTSFIVYLVVLILGIIFIKIVIKKEKLFNYKAIQPLLKMPILILIIISCLCYLLFLAITIPYQSTRYIYIVYPLIIVSVSLLLYYFLSILISNSKLKYALIITIYVITIFPNIFYIPNNIFDVFLNPQLKYNAVDNLYPNRKFLQKQLDKYHESRALILTFHDDVYENVLAWQTLHYYPDFLKFNQININFLDKVMKDSNLINDYALNNDNLIVFLYGIYNNQDIENYLLQTTKFSNIELLHKNDYELIKIYLLHK